MPWKKPDGAWPSPSANAVVANARSRDVLLPAAISGSVVASPPPQPVCQVVYAVERSPTAR